MEPTVVINATSIGARFDGIGAYGIHLLRALGAARSELRLTAVLGEAARRRFGPEGPPPGIDVRWVGGEVAPDRGTRGHLRRWMHAQVLALRHRRNLVFCLSQIEAPLWGGPRIVTVHDAIPLLFKQDHPRQYHYYRRFLGRALRSAAAVITPSEATRSLLRSIYGLPEEKLHVIPHGPTVPPRNGKPASPVKRPYVLCIAHASPTKNLDALVDAFGRITDRIREDLVIAGTGLDRSSLAALQGGNGVGTRVVIRPNVSEQEKIELLDGATVFVYPSLAEGFGLPPLEAMARGLPIVTARSGALSEVCAGAPVYVDPCDSPGMAAALYALLNDEGERRRMAARSRERVQAFSWYASARRHLELFRRILGSSRSS